MIINKYGVGLLVVSFFLTNVSFAKTVEKPVVEEIEVGKPIESDKIKTKKEIEDIRKSPKLEIKDKNNNVIKKPKVLSQKEKDELLKKRLEKTKSKKKKEQIKNTKKTIKKRQESKEVQRKVDEKERNYELLLKLLVSDDKENMNIALTEQEIKEKKAEEERKRKLADEAYDLRELNRQKKLLPIPKKTILIGDKRIVYADYTIYPYIPEVRDLIGDTIDNLSKTDKIKEKEAEQGKETSVITIQNGDIFMDNWIVDKTTDSYILYKHLYKDNVYVKKYMLNKDTK